MTLDQAHAEYVAALEEFSPALARLNAAKRALRAAYEAAYRDGATEGELSRRLADVKRVTLYDFERSAAYRYRNEHWDARERSRDANPP